MRLLIWKKHHEVYITNEVDRCPPERCVTGHLVRGGGQDQVHEGLGGQPSHRRVQAGYAGAPAVFLVREKLTRLMAVSQGCIAHFLVLFFISLFNIICSDQTQKHEYSEQEWIFLFVPWTWQDSFQKGSKSTKVWLTFSCSRSKSEPITPQRITAVVWLRLAAAALGSSSSGLEYVRQQTKKSRHFAHS